MQIIAGLLRWVRGFIPNGTLTRAVMALAGASALAQVFSLLVAPILTRIYTPDDYGALAVFNSLLGMTLIFATFRYELAVVLPREDDRALDVLALCIAILVTMTAVAGLAVWYLGDWLASVMDSPALMPWMWLIPVGVLSLGLYRVLSHWTLRRKRYKELARTKFSQSILGTSTMLAVGAVYAGPLGLLLGAIISQAAGVFLLQRDAVAAARKRTSRLSIERLTSAAYEYREFPLFASGAALLNTLAPSLPPLLLSALYAPEVAGWFGLAGKVVFMPLKLVGIALGQVFLSEAADIMRNRPNDLPGMFSRVTKRMLLPGAAIPVGGAISPFAFPILFGPEWAMAGTYAACMSVFCALQIVVSPISTIVFVRKRVGVQMVFDAIRAALVCIALCLPAVLHLSALVAVLSYSFVMAAMYGVYYIAYRKIALTPLSAAEMAAVLTSREETD